MSASDSAAQDKILESRIENHKKNFPERKMFWEVSRLLLRLLIGTEHRSSDSQHSIVDVIWQDCFVHKKLFD